MTIQVDSNNRFLISLLFFGTFACLEAIFPRRKRLYPRLKRWPSQMGIVLINVLLQSLVIKLVLPVATVGFGEVIQKQNWGILNLIQLPIFLSGIIAVVVLDLAIYFQHRLFHHVPILWNVHRMHHTDLDLDVSSGIRFHPTEILISFGIKIIVITVLGASPQAILVFEILLNASALFNHSNLYLPQGLDCLLRHVVVTSDMHRVHHSLIKNETNSNYGFCLSWWDKLFKTYRDQPELGHLKMQIGIAEFQSPQELSLMTMLRRGLGSRS